MIKWKKINKNILNFFNYVIKLIFIKERISDLEYIFKFKKDKKLILDALNIIREKYNILFYVQKKSQIIKDDEFFKKYGIKA